MPTSMNIKDSYLCDRHKTNQRSNICIHINNSLTNPSLRDDITPLFLERVTFDKHYEKYWLCESCAKNSGINIKGELHFDPALRAILDDEADTDDIDESIIVELPENIENIIVSACRECFIDKYGTEVKKIESSPNFLIQVSIR